MTDHEERLVSNLTEAIVALTATMMAFASASNLVTRCDLNAMEARIVKAFGDRVTPKQLEKLSTQLEEATAPLEKAVAENQPG